MKLSWRAEVYQLSIIALMFAVAAWAWPQVPDRLPVHWNIKGEVDGWGGKFMGLLLLPLTVLGIYLLTAVLPLVDPRRANYANFAKAYNAIRIAFAAFMAIVYGATVTAAFGHRVDMNTIILVAIAVLFFVIGNFMSKIRPNWFVGVRTPWTLSSKLSWDKTHRLAGWLFLVMGAMAVVLAFHQTGWMLALMLLVDAACVAWMLVYSYIVYRRDPERAQPAASSARTD
jgi:uncharacterized membrane protein